MSVIDPETGKPFQGWQLRHARMSLAELHAMGLALSLDRPPAHGGSTAVLWWRVLTEADAHWCRTGRHVLGLQQAVEADDYDEALRLVDAARRHAET